MKGVEVVIGVYKGELMIFFSGTLKKDAKTGNVVTLGVPFIPLMQFIQQEFGAVRQKKKRNSTYVA